MTSIVSETLSPVAMTRRSANGTAPRPVLSVVADASQSAPSSSAREDASVKRSPLALILAAVAPLTAYWRRHRQQRALETIPFELRKDIGWPATDEPHRRGR